MDNQKLSLLRFRGSANNVLIKTWRNQVAVIHPPIPFDTATGNLFATKRSDQFTTPVIDSNNGIIRNVVKNDMCLKPRTERIRKDLDILAGLSRHVAFRSAQVVSAVTGHAILMGEPYHAKSRSCR